MNDSNHAEYTPLSTCNGLCVSAADVGLTGYPGIAYPHPDCPEHGERHPFRWNGKTHDTHEGRLRWCECGAYEDEHRSVKGTPQT